MFINTDKLSFQIRISLVYCEFKIPYVMVPSVFFRNLIWYIFNEPLTNSYMGILQDDDKYQYSVYDALQ